MTTMKPRDVLDLPLPGNDADAATVREYLVELLRTVWVGGAGVRPFGNSGWQHDLYIPLMQAGLIAGELDEDDYVASMDTAAGDRIILAAIQELGRPEGRP